MSGLISLYPSFTEPTSPVSYSLFVKYWLQLMPTLLIAHYGGDFFRTCTTLKSTMRTVSESDTRFISAKCFWKNTDNWQRRSFSSIRNFRWMRRLPQTARLGPVFSTSRIIYCYYICKNSLISWTLLLVKSLTCLVCSVASFRRTTFSVCQKATGTTNRQQTLLSQCYILF